MLDCADHEFAGRRCQPVHARDGCPCPLRSIRLPALLGRSREPRALRFGGLTRRLGFLPRARLGLLLGLFGGLALPLGFGGVILGLLSLFLGLLGFFPRLLGFFLGLSRASVSLSSASSEASRSVSSSAILSSSPPPLHAPAAIRTTPRRTANVNLACMTIPPRRGKKKAPDPLPDRAPVLVGT